MSEFVQALIEKADAVDPRVLKHMHRMKEPSNNQAPGEEQRIMEVKEASDGKSSSPLVEKISASIKSNSDDGVENSAGAFSSSSNNSSAEGCPFCGSESEHSEEHESRNKKNKLNSILRHLIQMEE